MSSTRDVKLLPFAFAKLVHTLSIPYRATHKACYSQPLSIEELAPYHPYLPLPSIAVLLFGSEFAHVGPISQLGDQATLLPGTAITSHYL